MLEFSGLVVGLVFIFGSEITREPLFYVLCLGCPVAYLIFYYVISYLRFGRGNANQMSFTIDGEQFILSIGRGERSFPIKQITLEKHGNAGVTIRELRVYAGETRKNRKRLLRLLQLDSHTEIKAIMSFVAKYKVRIKDKQDYTPDSITPSGAYV